ADDWLTPGAIEYNLSHMLRDKKLAYASGAHKKVYVDENHERVEKREVTRNHYWHLLQGNYIGVPACVMFRRWVFDEFQYDVTPPNSCSDYDLYLRVARTHPVCHHTEITAAYRIHSASMSANIPGMLETVLKVLRQQRKHVKTSAEKRALKRGEAIWKEYYCKEMYKRLAEGKINPSQDLYSSLFRFNQKYFLKYLLRQKYSSIISLLK
ncbi:family 2 glycosyl transferase, partial [Pontibacter silvestris]|nr:family 2 glycosyl transferase [Pontibacter silvestris]